MGKRNKILTLTISLLLLALVLPAGAQQLAAITVNDSMAIEEADEVALDVYFTLHGTDQAEVQSAMVLLEDGSRYEARVEKPPYYIALLIDASGSMADVLDEIQQAANDVIAMAPPETHFAVIRFDEKIELVQTFTNDPEKAAAAVNRVEVGDSGTCLYDVVYTAVQTLAQISQNAPSRSMILFTDGRDEVKRGTGDACSKNTYDQLVSFATGQGVPVPIHTVGIASSQRRINTSSLSSLAAATGGLSASGGDAALNSLFEQIMADVRSQWLARASLLPTQGYHRGSLFVTLSDGSMPLSAPISLAASRSFQRLPQPVTIEMANFTYNETADLFFFDIALGSFASVGSLQLEVLDSQDNVQVYRRIFSSATTNQQIRLETNNLTGGGGYLVRVSPRTQTGDAVMGADGTPLVVEHTFRYDPPKPLSFSIDSVAIKDEAPAFNLRTFQVDDDQAELVLRLHMENGEQVAQINGRLLSQQGNLQVAEFSGEAPFDTVRLPLEVGAGSYTVLIDALDMDGSRLGSNRLTFTYAPPRQPIPQAVTALRTNPLLTLLVLPVLLLVGLIGWRFGVSWGRRGMRRAGPADEIAPLARSDSGAMPHVTLRILDSADATLTGTGPEVTHVPFTIGREGCDLSIPGDRHISRQHAEITFDNGIFYIADKGSSNGTFVNETKVAAGQPMPLIPGSGSTIRIGRTTNLTFTPGASMAKSSGTPSNGANGHAA